MKVYCDGTIAILNKNGKVVRHLVSGLLGPNAPKPLQSNSLSQKVIFDGKNDQGEYLRFEEGYQVRVGAGLKASFNKEVYATPKRKLSEGTSMMCAQPEGVYVYEGGVSMDFVRLFDHDGNYVRTVYPFPANKMEGFKDLHFRT